MRCVPGCLGLGLCLLLAAGANAEDFPVTSTSDSGAGSLREAVVAANDSDLDPPHTIVFTLPADSTITLLDPLELLDQNDAITFDATGAPGLTVENAVIELNGHDLGIVDVGMGLGAIGIGGGDTVTFTANNDFEVSADIGDIEGAPGDLVKDGMAELRLSGDNTAFTGDLTIEEGTVVGDTMSLPQTIDDDGALVFDQQNDGIYAGEIEGSGTVRKTGMGDLTITGMNSYAGGTTISEGTLIIDEATSLPAEGGVVNNAELVFIEDDALAGEFAGEISGTGSVTKMGPDDLTLTGSNSYSGGTTVEMGNLIGDTAALQGDFALAAGTTLQLVQADGAGTLAGSITGDGAVMKSGLDDVSLTGSNDYTGGTTVAEGVLIVTTNSLPGAPFTTTIAPGSTLVFNQSFTGTYDGDLMGGGDLQKRGGGLVELSGASTVGQTDITAGTLDVTGMLTSDDVFVGASGTLAGNGTVDGAVDVAGAVSPGGDQVDVLAVTGNATFGPNSRFIVDVNDMSLGDRLDAGSATIDPNSELVIRPAPGNYSGGSTVKILEVDMGGIANAFDLGEEFAFLDATYNDFVADGFLELTLQGSADFADFDGTPNQQAVAGALDVLEGSPDPDIMEIFDNAITLRESEAAPALDALSGEGISASTSARQALGARHQRSLHRRMRSVLFEREEAWPYRPPPGPPARRPDGPTDVAATPRWADDERGLGAWVDVHGILGGVDGDGNSADADYGLGGATLGADFRLGDHGLLGLAAGYVRTHLEVDDRDTEGDADTVQAALYAAWATPVVYAGLSGRYAWSASETERDIDFGDLSSTARGDFDSHDYGLRGELALRAFEARDVAFEPLAALAWSRLTRESFDESGAGALGLDVDDETLDSTQLQLGGRVRALFQLDEQSVLAPELRAFWLHEFGDTERQVEAALGGAPFTVDGAEAPRDGALVGAGWAVSIGRNARATLDYDLHIDSDRLDHIAGLAIRGRF